MNNSRGVSGERRESHNVTFQWCSRDQSKTATLNNEFQRRSLTSNQLIRSQSKTRGYTTLTVTQLEILLNWSGDIHQYTHS